MIIKFKCGFCNDGVFRTRKGMRDHLGENHLKESYFNIGVERKVLRKEIVREAFV